MDEHTAQPAPAIRSDDASQTAREYIDEQLALEADAKEILPYKFDKCTYPLGPLRQSIFACLTCSPPPASPAQVWTPAGMCYACSISCHGDHTLVELFSRRNFVCDCGTTRMPSTSPCALRLDPVTGQKGVSLQEAAPGNSYNQNFQNRFCGCAREYDAETEKGTMYQCIGLGTVDTGGCGEDWWHPHCLMGLSPDWLEAMKPEKEHVSTDEGQIDGEGEAPVPEGFPPDDDFASLVCYKCVEANPWIKPYASTRGFLPALMKDKQETQARGDNTTLQASLKRKALNDEADTEPIVVSKRLKEESTSDRQQSLAIDKQTTAGEKLQAKHEKLGSPPSGVFSLLLEKDFREHICHCPQCFPNLIPHPQLREEEDEYEPSLSDSEQSLVDGSGARSHGTGSIMDRGEAALSTMDRVKAIEGVMVYNHLKDKVKEFLRPYADSGKTVGAEDIKAYFEKLRGDEAAIKEAGKRPTTDHDDQNEDHRREQSGH